MNDIVKRLRTYAMFFPWLTVLSEAADEIERLQKALDSRIK
jgi:hypothetical protein